MTRNVSSNLGTNDSWTAILVTLDFTLPNNGITAENASIISLPKELGLQSYSTFNIKDEVGNVIAIIHEKVADKVIALAYTGYAKKHPNIFKQILIK